MMSTPLLAFLFDFSFPFIGEEKKIAVSFIEYYKHVGIGNFIVLFAFGSGEDVDETGLLPTLGLYFLSPWPN